MGTLHDDQYTFSIKPRENQNTHFRLNNSFFFRKILAFMRGEKECTAGQATDDNMAHEHCMLDT